MSTQDEIGEWARLLPWFRYARHWPDETHCEMVWLLAHTALAVQRACLVGNPAPVVQEMYERMSNPQVGDVVLETGTCWRPNWPERALGRLVEIERSPHSSFEDTYVVESLYFVNRAITRWQNCSFIALPIDEAEFLGTRGPVVFTRETLRVGLAASGFELKR